MKEVNKVFSMGARYFRECQDAQSNQLERNLEHVTDNLKETICGFFDTTRASLRQHACQITGKFEASILSKDSDGVRRVLEIEGESDSE